MLSFLVILIINVLKNSSNIDLIEMQILIIFFKLRLFVLNMDDFSPLDYLTIGIELKIGFVFGTRIVDSSFVNPEWITATYPHSTIYASGW